MSQYTVHCTKYSLNYPTVQCICSTVYILVQLTSQYSLHLSTVLFIVQCTSQCSLHLSIVSSGCTACTHYTLLAVQYCKVQHSTLQWLHYRATMVRLAHDLFRGSGRAQLDTWLAGVLLHPQCDWKMFPCLQTVQDRKYLPPYLQIICLIKCYRFIGFTVVVI